MFERQMTKRLATRLALPTTIIIMLLSLGIGLVVAEAMFTRFMQKAEDARRLTVEGISNNVQLAHQFQLQRARQAVQSLNAVVGATRPAAFGTVTIEGVEVPNLRVGEKSIVNDLDLLKQLEAATGAQPSLMVRSSADDFVTVSTNLRRADGTSTIGEKIERTDAAHDKLLRGESDYGTGFVGTEKTGFKSVLRGYEPIRAANNDVIGAWMLTFPADSLAELGNQISGTTILETGFAALVDTRGNVVFRSGNAPAETLGEIVKDAAGKQQFNYNGWRVQQNAIAEAGFIVVGAYSESDPLIRKETFGILTWTVLIALAVTVLVGGLTVFIATRVTAQLNEAVDVAEKIAEGDVSVEVRITAEDEVGQLQVSMQKMVEYLRETAGVADQIAAGKLNVNVPIRSGRDRFGIALNNMLRNVLKLVQSQDERDRLQASIMKLLEEVSEVASGDLTTEAEVTSEVTGAIADAFNNMIVELRTIVTRVKDATHKVDDSAHEIERTTELLAEGSARQAQQLAVTSGEIEGMTVSIQKVSESAQRSAEVAGESLETARDGSRAVQNNITAMNRIRTQVQETAKRIKRLGERSQEIGEIVQVIEDLADRTGLLALNASLQAAAAGDAGRGFAVVAEEVERLAERSADATHSITALTRSIQSETKDVVASMEDTIKEVVNGSQLANDAGQALLEIEAVSNQLAELIGSISQLAREQAAGSETLTRSMTDIASVTELVAAESSQAAGRVKGLVSLTDDLRGSVATFKVSNDAGQTGEREVDENSFADEQSAPADDELPTGSVSREYTAV